MNEIDNDNKKLNIKLILFEFLVVTPLFIFLLIFVNNLEKKWFNFSNEFISTVIVGLIAGTITGIFWIGILRILEKVAKKNKREDEGEIKLGASKVIALIISGGSFLIGVLNIWLSIKSGQSEGMLFILGFLGMPLTVLGGMGNAYMACFLYILQYQLIAFLVFKWVKSIWVAGILFAVLLTYFIFILIQAAFIQDVIFNLIS